MTFTRTLLFSFVMLGALACTDGGDEAAASRGGEAAPSDPRAILERSAEAMRSVRSVAYDFTWGAPDSPSGWATGRTLMRHVTDLDDSWIRVTGEVHAQPQLDVEGYGFEYTVDGERAWSREGEGAGWKTAPVDAGANTLATSAVLGYLPELVEAQPLWKELGPLATTVRMLEPEEVDGEVCDVVEVVVQPEHGDASTSRWSIARRDGLPRRASWFSSTTPSMVFTLSAVETGVALDRGHFQIDDAAVEPAAPAAGLGKALPDFALATSDGATLTREDLAGRVAVLDFWNTWCYLCRTMAPEVHRLAAELADRPVQFVGVNIYETGDPIAYWRQAGEPFPLLLEGDELAIALDLPWQPGIAVIGHDGTLLWKQLGASPDRTAKILAAVEDGLSRLADAG